MRQSFEFELMSHFLKNLPNRFLDNHDSVRFGEETTGMGKKLKKSIKERLLRNYTSNTAIRRGVRYLEKFINEYGDYASETYFLLNNDQSKNLYLDLICFRLLGKEKIRITDTSGLLKKRESTSFTKVGTEAISVKFNAWKIENYLVPADGQTLKILSRPSGIFTEFVWEQYSYLNDKIFVGAEPGDCCIDAGACWGDSTLYLGVKAGQDGKIFAFEFIPGNLSVLRQNLKQNQDIVSNVEIIESPLWSNSDLPVWFIDKGPASQVSFEELADADGKTSTKTIDGFVLERKIQQVNFIKMDIEGAELKALEGAKNTILRDKPKLAICIYHSLEDFTRTAIWLRDLNLGYKFFLKHATIHTEETVLFAI